MKAITCYICGKKKIPKAQVPSKNELFLKLESTPRRKSNKICNRCYRDNLKMKKFIQENKDIKEENSCLKQELDYLKELVQQQKKEINHQFSIYKEVKKQLKTTLSWVNILNEKCDSIARTEMELRENLCEVQKEKENLKNQQITIHSHLMYQLTKENQDLKTQVEKNQIKIGNLRDSVYYWKITKPKRKEKKKEEEQMKRDSLKNLSQNQTSLDGENENNQNENNQNEMGKGKEKTKIESKSIKKFRKLYENDRRMRSAFNIGTKIVGISISKFYRFLNLFEIKTQDGLQDYCDEVKIKLAPIVNSMAESILDLSAEEVEQSTDPSSTQTMEHMKNHFISDKDIDKIANSSRKLFINKELTNSSSLLDLKEKIYQLVISNEKKNSIERKDQNKNNSNQQIENESQPEIDSTKKIDSIFSHDVAYSHRNNRAADACAIFIEANTKFNRIIHYQRMSSTSTIHPQSLEGFLIPKGIQKLSEKYNILATVHDQNTSSKVKQCFPNIMHLLDPWHVTRSIRRRYNKLVNKFCGSNKKKRSKEESEKMRKKKEHLMSWKESIIFHFLRCAKSCQGDMTTLLSEWFRYFLHAKGDHSLCPKNSPCTKNENSNENKHPEDKKITNKEEEAFFKMILSDFTIIKKLIFCRYFLSTSYNESFFSTLNGYREKISHFKNYNLLYQLAIIDWNQNREKENEKEINLGNQENEIEFNEKNALQENQKKEKDMEWQKELLHLSLPGIFQKSTSYLKNLTLSRIKKKKRNSSEEIVPPQKEKKRSRKSPKKEASLKTKKNLISTFLLSKIQPNLFDFENYSLLPTFQIHFKDALEMLNPKETHKQTQKETENSCPNIHDLHIFSNQNPSLLSRKSKIDNKNDVPIQTKTNNHNAIQNIQLPKPREIQLLEEDYIHNKREEIKEISE
ncbi:hypothetical protein M0811_03984 [Anaeramoeba ignava]|uniref:Transposase n=1 Tax=Anaeramoeba ignava TaxID=1746090 RepID=A0A9Q0LVU5_ANAIG|nr:hypothetical protein M0811_03984 [Anaeramoeba ignava]